MNFSRKPVKFLSAALCIGLATTLAASPVAVQSVEARPLGMPRAQGLPKSLADLIEHVSPAVVNIKVITGGEAAGTPTQDTTLGQGSGFIVTPDGKVVTNYHVIEGSDKITVDFANGEEYEAKIIGTDEETDLAVLQISAKRKFDYVEFHHGKAVRIGDWALAIGNPFGIGQSSSIGIISAIGRERVESGSYVDYIQTDATVNRGNSGGPLFNLEGKVIGVNSAIYSPTGASVGIAFVIPHTFAQEIVTDLIKNGRVDRGFLGVSLREAVYEQEGGYLYGGATIETIGVGSPADKAGMKVENIILRVNNTTVRNAVEATRAIAKLRAGEHARFMVERADEKVEEITVLMAARPAEEKARERATAKNSGASATASTPPPTANSMGNTGLSLVGLSATFRDSIGMRTDQVGLYVDAVAPGSSAAQKGIKAGMVILEADGKPLAQVSTFRNIIAAAKKSGRRTLTLLVRTINGSETYTSILVN